jgi:hypothetical protein
MEDTTLEVLRLVRDTTALAIGAAHHDPSVGGVCLLVHVGTHKLELAVAEVSPGKVHVRARKSVAGILRVSRRSSMTSQVAERWEGDMAAQVVRADESGITPTVRGRVELRGFWEETSCAIR